LAVDDDPAVLAAVARDERGLILAGPDVRARSLKRVTSTMGEGSTAVSLIHQYLWTNERTRCAICSKCRGKSGRS
jgi:hypothetical protein